VTPYSIVHLPNGVGIAGIDVETSKKLSHRSIFLVNLEGKSDKSSKQAAVESKLEVVTIQG
jgi:hypothetical protein